MIMKKSVMKKKREWKPKGLNPLVVDDNLRLSVNVITDSKLLTFDGQHLLPSEYKVSRDEFVRIFTAAHNRKLIASLGNSAKSLYLHVLYSLESGKDWIKLNGARYMAENSVGSINTYKSALSELVQLNILREISDHKGVYWINPRLFFCGSRIKKYPDSVVVYKGSNKG